ncbi:hypothetical protein [Nostoc sp.]|uniref:hypothetical protein n=1 Tax=Nostoc sp. TaxID=1180 RepID=UPI002FFB953B
MWFFDHTIFLYSAILTTLVVSAVYLAVTTSFLRSLKQMTGVYYISSCRQDIREGLTVNNITTTEWTSCPPLVIMGGETLIPQ